MNSLNIAPKSIDKLLKKGFARLQFTLDLWPWFRKQKKKVLNATESLSVLGPKIWGLVPERSGCVKN